MKRAVNQPETLDLGIYAGVFIKTWTVRDRGTLLPQHSHEFPHISYIVSGAVRVWRDDVELGEFIGPCPVKVPALAKHRFLTLSDNVVILCIHNADHADPDGELPIHAEHQSRDGGLSHAVWAVSGGDSSNRRRGIGGGRGRWVAHSGQCRQERGG